MMKKLIIAGGRDFHNAELLHNAISELGTTGQLDPQAELVCGMARGADMLGYHFFKECGNTILEYPADWAKHPRAAGYIRNEEMAKVADGLLAFWDGKSKGTKHMIDTMENLDKPVFIVLYEINFSRNQ